MIRELKGWHVATMFITGFGVIIAVNLTLAFQAVATFPGLEVKNSYVASQSFDADRAAQEALGWMIAAHATPKRLRLVVMDANGDPVKGLDLQGTLGRATHVKDDTQPVFLYANGGYEAEVDLAPGNWNLRFEARDGAGGVYRQRLSLYVSG